MMLSRFDGFIRRISPEKVGRPYSALSCYRRENDSWIDSNANSVEDQELLATLNKSRSTSTFRDSRSNTTFFNLAQIDSTIVITFLTKPSSNVRKTILKRLEEVLVDSTNDFNARYAYWTLEPRFSH